MRDNDQIRLDKDPTAAESSHGLDKLNEMMHALKAEGIDTDWADITLNDDIPLDRRHIRSIIALLALELVPPSRPIPIKVASDAAVGTSALLSGFVDIPTLEMDPGLRNRTLDTTGNDFDTG